MKALKIKAYGKINIGLDVVGKRPNGYHDVRMIMQTVDIYDLITISQILQPEIRIDTNLYYVPSNENNLAYKAAKILFDEFDIKSGIKIFIKKQIPVSAGMAGGSSDAAAVLYGINKLYSLGLSTSQLMERAVTLGADIPYCLVGGTALAEGIGEKITRLNPFPKCYILIAKPGFGVSTKHVYQNLKWNEVENHPNIKEIINGIDNNDIKHISKYMDNVLESVTIKEHPFLEQIKKRMIEKGALNSIMSGSGPTVFGIFDSRKSVTDAYITLKREKIAKKIYVTSVINTGGDIFEGIKISSR